VTLALLRKTARYGAALAGLAAAQLAMSNIGVAHSASDAYLTLTVDPAAAGKVHIHGQWDIALRDLDFVLKLDDDGDGRLTWGEVRHHRADIEGYAYRNLRLDAAGRACRLEPGRQLVTDHADGAYAALFFDAVCSSPPRRIALRYSLFFGIDPSHRCIFVLHSGDDVATALLSPQNDHLQL
jgi:hypothetical protein